MKIGKQIEIERWWRDGGNDLLDGVAGEGLEMGELLGFDGFEEDNAFGDDGFEVGFVFGVRGI